jgi:hypothetical protein
MLDRLAAMLVGGWRFIKSGRTFGLEGFAPVMDEQGDDASARHQGGRADAATLSPSDCRQTR